jgi:hypothetical protein
MIFKKKKFIKPLLFVYLFAILCAANAQVFVSPTDKNLSYSGRIGFDKQDEAAFYWGGSAVTVCFKGTGASAVFKDKPFNNHFLVLIDRDEKNAFKNELDTIKHAYQLAKNLRYGEHSIEIFKISNARGASLFLALNLDRAARLLKPERKPKRKIEFYGSSITAGHGVDVPLMSK